MTIQETMRKIHATQDAAMAGRLSDHLRGLGMGYDSQVRTYARHNTIPLRDARDEWEDLMARSEECAW